MLAKCVTAMMAYLFSTILPCSTTVVQSAVNTEVVGSNPTGAVGNLAEWSNAPVY